MVSTAAAIVSSTVRANSGSVRMEAPNRSRNDDRFDTTKRK
jgi:hypothetical protein